MGRGRYKKKPSYQKGDNNMDENFVEIIEEPVYIAEEPVIIEQPSPIFKAKVEHPSLRIRRAPSTTAEIVGTITDWGVYDIFAVHDGWGQLEDGNWIMLVFTKKQ